MRTLSAHRGSSIDGSDVLRAFDHLRTEVATDEVGAAGTTIEYDALVIDWHAIRAASPGAVIALTAVVTARRPWAHEVEYCARLLDAPRASCREAPVIARARGWTLNSARGR